MAEAGVPKDFLDLMQKMWSPMNFPMPGVPMPTASIQELEKKIADLKAVESWLTVNIGLLQMTVKTLEMQKSALESLAAGLGGQPTSPGGKK